MIIIGITGKATNSNGNDVGSKEVGKDTVALLLRNHLSKRYDVHITAYAKPLKEALIAGYGEITADKVYNQDQKEQELSNGWTPREMMQRFGTDVVRNLNEDFGNPWLLHMQPLIDYHGMTALDKLVKTVFNMSIQYIEKYPLIFKLARKELVKKMMTHNFPFPTSKPVVLIVTDIRFENERKQIETNGGIIVQVQRKLDRCSSKHVSEQNLIKRQDYVIENFGTVEELETTVYNFVTGDLQKHL